MKTIGMTAVAALMALPVYAGNLTPAPAETPVYAPAPVPVSLGGDWTGAYVGAQLGYGDVTSDNGISGDDAIGGIHAGYNYDLGTVVLGGEIDYDATNIDLSGGAGKLDSVARLKLKVGYDLGRTLIYATGGAARADTGLGSDNGYFGGIGVAYKYSDSVSFGGELLGHRFDNFKGTGTDLKATTAALRVSYHF